MNKELKETYRVDQFADSKTTYGTPSDEWYTVEYLLSVVDKAGDWSDLVIEGTHTAADVILTLACGYDVDTDAAETLDDIQDAVEAAIAAKGNESDE
jgi:hypothetical protein